MPSLRIHQKNQNKPHFITITVLEWISIFIKLEYYQTIIDSLKYCQKNKGLQLFGFVIMPNHIHMIVKALNSSLAQTIADFKRYTTNESYKLLRSDNRSYIKRLLNKSFQRKKGYKNQIWQRENYPESIETEQFFEQKLNYIHENPVMEGYVDYPEEWRFSSARNYSKNDHSVIEVITDYDKLLEAVQ